MKTGTKNLNDLTAEEEELIEYSDTWTEQDLQDISAFALSHTKSLKSHPRQWVVR